MHKKKLAIVMSRAEQLCKARGVRLTLQRRTVLELLCASGKPLSAYELLDQMRATTKNPTPPMVYRALDFLLNQGPGAQAREPSCLRRMRASGTSPRQSISNLFRLWRGK